MPNIQYVCPNGEMRAVFGQQGLSLMEAALKEGVPGIVAECGGAAACATCHVYIDDKFLEVIGVADDLEAEMLEEAAAERRRNSRLACQVKITDKLEGLIVEIAPVQ